MDTLQSNIQLVMGNRAKQMDIAKIEERITELKNKMIGFVEENARCGADNTDFDEHYAKISAELKELQNCSKICGSGGLVGAINQEKELQKCAGFVR